MPETIDIHQEGNALRFIAFGDSGSGSPAQKSVADQLVRQHDHTPYELVLLLGDNLYPNGDAPRYGEGRFTALYRPLLEREVEFRPTLGNHDISGPLGVGFPTFGLSNEKGHLHFFKMPGPYYDFALGDIHFFIINTNRFHKKQRHWLADRLSKSDRPWKIVCGHHPVYSSGRHGSTPYLKRRLKPLLERHGVNLYLAGHEHDYERFASINGVTYIVSGGGGANLRGFGRACPHSLVRLSAYHFLFFEVSGNMLEYKVFDEQGTVIDSETFTQAILFTSSRKRSAEPQGLVSQRG